MCSLAQIKNNAKENKWQIGIFASTIDKPTPLAMLNIGIDYPYFGQNDRINKSFALGITANYFFKSIKAVRILIGISHNDINDHDVGELGSMKTVYDHKIKQDIINISPGFFWNMNHDKLNFYGGFEIPVIIYCKLSLTGSYQEYSLSSGDLSRDYGGTVQADGGYALGPGIFSGFNIQIFKRIFLGGEFDFAVLYNRVGGDIKGVGYDSFPIQQIETSKDSQKIITYYNPRSIGQIHIYYSF
jgi:hypothetical protein